MKNTGKITDNRYRKLSDTQLVYSFVQHNEPLAATTLYERYGHLLFGIVCHFFKEDAKIHSEKIFLIILDKLKQYKEDLDFKEWLFSVADDYLQYTVGKKTDIVLNNLPKREWDLGSDIVMREVEAKLNSMTSEQRTCVDLFYTQKKTIEEVSNITRLPMDAIKHYLQTARMQVYQHLSHIQKQDL